MATVNYGIYTRNSLLIRLRDAKERLTENTRRLRQVRSECEYIRKEKALTRARLLGSPEEQWHHLKTCLQRLYAILDRRQDVCVSLQVKIDADIAKIRDIQRFLGL